MDSVRVGFLQPKEHYLMIKNESDQALKLNVGKRKKITIAEGMKLYQVLGAQKFSKISHDTYAGIVSQNLLPERSID